MAKIRAAFNVTELAHILFFKKEQNTSRRLAGFLPGVEPVKNIRDGDISELFKTCLLSN